MGMYKKVIIMLGLVLMNWAVSNAQVTSAYFVQFKISAVTSESQALMIDKKIGNKKGILTTHTDFRTSTYFCTLDMETDYTFENFESWFIKLGFEISCFNKGLQGVGTMISPHELKNCEENNNSE